MELNGRCPEFKKRQPMLAFRTELVIARLGVRRDLSQKLEHLADEPFERAAEIGCVIRTKVNVTKVAENDG
jgi:hypothetical protein